MKKITYSIYHCRGFRLFNGFSLIFLLVLSGCGLDRTILFPQPGPSSQEPVVEEPITIESSRKGPAEALYREAKVSMAQGNNQQAELAIERALRIEPGNAFYWYTMGKIKYRQGAYEEAIQLCLKSRSLAGRHTKLVHANDRLIDLAQKDADKRKL